MPPRVKIFRQVSCTLMLAMYVLFLCFQVNYNLAIASKVKLHQQIANEKHAFSENLIAKQKHTAVLAKSKTAPTKRFHPKFASVAPQYFASQPLVHVAQPLHFYYPANFIGQPALPYAPRRGPPVFPAC